MSGVRALDMSDRKDIVDRQDLADLLVAFYSRAFADDLLGPVFVDVAHMDLPAHLPIMCDFWETVLFRSGRYRRNALRVHAALHDKTPLTSLHLGRWLALWSETIDERHAGVTSDLAKLQARRIAWSFNRRLNGRSSGESHLPRPPISQRAESVSISDRREILRAGRGCQDVSRLGRSRHSEQDSRTSLAVEAPDRLATEHADLLRNVIARADEVLTMAATSRWPGSELARLIDYLRSELISQTRIEEQLLFADPEGSSSEAISRLVRDHVHLRYALEDLTDCTGDHSRRDTESVAETVRGLVTQLREHLGQEREVVSQHANDTAWQQAAAAMEHRPHAWYPLTHSPVIDLDAFSSGQDLEAVPARVRQLRPGEQITLVGSTDPRRLCNRLLQDRNLTVRYVVDGPQTWQVTVTRRRAD